MAESQAQARQIRFTAAVARGLRESAVIAIGVAAIVLLIALATYSPADSGFSLSAASSAVHNRIGPVGHGWPTCSSSSSAVRRCFCR